MSEHIGDVTILDGSWQAEKPTIILDADTARDAISAGCLHDFILDALNALELSGKQIVIVSAERQP